MLKSRIIADLQKAVKDLGFEVIDIVLSIPKNPSFGDYSTNLALQLAKLDNGYSKQPASTSDNDNKLKRGENPQDIANQIVSNLGNLSYLSHLEVKGGGFINFFIKTEDLIQNLGRPLEFKATDQGQKVMVEYTDPNPFKEFHIGHVFSNAVGESIARLFEASGATVFRANFFGDVGMHVAKAIFGIKQKLKEENLNFGGLEEKELTERIKFMGQSYVIGSTAYDNDPKAQDEIKRLNLLIFVAAQQYWQEEKDWKPRVDYRKYIEKIDEGELQEIQAMWVTGRKWSLDYFETIYAVLGTKFKGYYPESLTGEWGYDFVLEGLKKGIFEKSEGAIVYRGEKKGLHTRVFINKLGLPTYETKDIGNAPLKYSEFPYDKSIIVTANEISDYFKVVIEAMKEINPQLGEKTKHIGHGVVKLKDAKMSSRTGKILTFDELFETVKTKIESLLKEFDVDEKEKVLNAVSIGAIKFAMLKHQPSGDTFFDIEKSVALEGDSGPYIQYSYARARSILKKSSEQLSDLGNLGSLTLEKEERQLLQKIEYFEGVVDEAKESMHPNVIATYLLELAADFNLFYQKHRIVDAEDDKRMLRLSLTKTVADILKQGLNLLGIEAPERM